MSSIPTSAMPRAYTEPVETPSRKAPSIAYQVLAIVLAPAVIPLGLTAAAVSMLRDKFREKPAEVPSAQQVPV